MAFLLALILALPFPQDPPPESLKVAARLAPAFGRIPELPWKTYVLDIANTSGGELDIVATVEGYASGSRALRREKLAPNARKRIFFYLPNEYGGGRVHYRIADAEGRELLKDGRDEEWNRGSSTSLWCLALMDRLPAHKPATAETILCPEAHFPDRWIGLEGFTAIMMRDYRLESLLPAQRAALGEWLRRGGTLFVYPGSNPQWLSTAAVQELVPVDVGPSTERLRMEPLEKLYGPFREQAPFPYFRIRNGRAAGAGDPPTAFEFRRGAGRVFVIPYDLDRAPFDSWPGGERYRDALMALAAASAAEEAVTRIGDNASLVHAWASAEVNALPSFVLLLGLATLFIVAVGPVNYLVLKRLNKMLLIVVTVPAISILFLVLVVGVGHLLRGTSTVTQEVCLLSAGEGDDFASETRVFSLFSPAARTYEISFDGGLVGTPAGEDWDSHTRYYRRHSMQEQDRSATYDQTDRWILRDCAFSQWQARPFLGKGIRAVGGGVRFELRDGEVVIDNQSPFGITGGFAIDPARFQPGLSSVRSFGEVPAGQKRTLALAAAAPTGVEQTSGGLERRVLGSWVNTVGASITTGRAFLVCVLDRTPGEIGIDAGRSPESERLSLLQVFEDGR